MEEIIKIIALIARMFLFFIQAICEFFAYSPLDKLFTNKRWTLYVVLAIILIMIAFYFQFKCDMFEC